MELNRLIDHTLLKPDATDDDVRRLCAEAREYDFFSAVSTRILFLSWPRRLQGRV